MAKQTRNNQKPKIKKKSNGSVRRKAVFTKSNPNFKKTPTMLNRKMQDVRQKLILKKRTVTDARDVLAKMAKTHDARSRLDRMRSKQENRKTTPIASSSSKIKVIGKNIVQKVDVHGKISLVTNKARNTSNINLAIQKQLGLLPATRMPAKRIQYRKPQSPKSVTPTNKPVRNERSYGPSMAEAARVYNKEMYRWLKPDLRPASHLINALEPTRQAMRDVMREELLMANRGWSNLITPKPMRLQPSGYVDLDAADDDVDMPVLHLPASRVALKGFSRTSNVHSRLDGNQDQFNSHGIMSDIKTKVVIPVGHRIVVSNLHPSVTEDDIKELFEDKGQLLSAKLVRPGVAEVIYKHLKDGQKAVDTYHNRQLDGQPMKCLLVNKRPVYQPSGAALSNLESSLSRRHLSDRFDDLVPSMRTIHKVLFQK
ncbi:uncharacterized protein LOC109539114 isoform X2 [Dendroctonus ponderosae]|uniref:RRM domain-containing protein n=1 Tax=Dendroctonus ponderosae TaxID=77166 RepID=U4UG41_DENPD|nr:uncharacterized protein LOC109539114 isoform X2 [Dendroctonus ponderosae]ERL88855.1 hypothetical protein D910_06237 [Dendroctonus ponderosae]